MGLFNNCGRSLMKIKNNKGLICGLQEHLEELKIHQKYKKIIQKLVNDQ